MLDSRFLAAAGLLLASVVLTSPALAERNDPGSLLLFPEYDTRPGSVTFLTVTNTNADAVTGSIRVHFNYVDGQSCLKMDAQELLTPRDTITVMARAHAPGHGRGFCYAFALGITAPGAVDFDHLIGSVIVLDGSTTSQYTMNALVFEGKTGEGMPTDVDMDGIRDLDGLEYAMAPDKIAVPRFFGQFPPDPGARDPYAELVLVGLTGTRGLSLTAFDMIGQPSPCRD